MSRPLRIQYPGAWYHIMNRGLNRRRIFHEDMHRQEFLQLLDDIHERYGVQTHAYCLMDNHYHLILHTPQKNLSRAMRHINGLYTQYFNRETKRDGPLFRGRYKSILIEAEHYLLELSRYIHLNPTTAKVCAQPEGYFWSSYPAYLRLSKRPSWLYCEEVLGHCSEKQLVKDYQKFVEEGVDENIKNVFSRKQWPSVLGEQEWIADIKERYLTHKAPDDEVPSVKSLLQAIDFGSIENLMQKVAAYYGLPIMELQRRGHRHAENVARNSFIYVAITYAGYANKALAEVLGHISDAGISQMRRRMQDRLMLQPALQVEIKKLKEHLLMSNVET